MTLDEWNRTQDQVTEAMLAYTRPFVTPLTWEEDTTVWLEGSGSYVEMHTMRLVLTCEHVTRRSPLHYRFHGSDNVYGYCGQWTMKPHPVDIAFAPISDSAWNATSHQAATIPYARFATKHQISEQAELLFFRGYAYENAHYGFGVHQANATGYCSQEKLDGRDPSIFEMFWEPRNTRFTAGTSADARAQMKHDNPQGLSGSLVWNTRWLETQATGRIWIAEDAVVTGMLRRWDMDTKTLLVYRVEHVRAWFEGTPNGRRCSLS